MITNLGKTHIKRFLAGWETEIAGSIGLGVGSSTPVATQERLDYELGRVDISLTTYDFDEDVLVFKGVLEETFDGVIHEVGLFSGGAIATTTGSKLILSFDSEDELWLQGTNGATYSTSGTRIGNDSVLVNVAASGSVTVSYADIMMDLSGYTAADTFSFAVYSANANVSTVRYRFYTDTANYYNVTLQGSRIIPGFNVLDVPFSQAVAVGAPRWEEISRVDVTVSATAAGAATLNLEGIRVEDLDYTDTGHILIARTKLETPFVKTAGSIQEIEFPLGVNI